MLCQLGDISSFQRLLYKYENTSFLITAVALLNSLYKVAQTPTTCNLQPRLSELFKKTLSKTSAPSSGKKFQRQRPIFGNMALFLAIFGSMIRGVLLVCQVSK